MIFIVKITMQVLECGTQDIQAWFKGDLNVSRGPTQIDLLYVWQVWHLISITTLKH